MIVYLGSWLGETNQLRALGDITTPILYSYFEIQAMQANFDAGKSWGFNWNRKIAPGTLLMRVCEDNYVSLFSFDSTRA